MLPSKPNLGINMRFNNIFTAKKINMKNVFLEGYFPLIIFHEMANILKKDKPDQIIKRSKTI